MLGIGTRVAAVRAGLDLTGLTYMSKYTVRVHMLGNCSADDGTSAGPGFSFDDSSLEALGGDLAAVTDDKAFKENGRTDLT